MKKLKLLLFLGAFAVYNVSCAQTESNSANVTDVEKLNSLLNQGYDFKESNFGLKYGKVFVLEHKNGNIGIIKNNGEWLIEPYLGEEYISDDFRWEIGNLYCYKKEKSGITDLIYIDVKKGDKIFTITFNNANKKEKLQERILLIVNYLFNTNLQSLPKGCDYPTMDNHFTIEDGFMIFKSKTDDTESVINKNGELIISGKRNALYLGNNIFYTDDANTEGMLIEIKQ